MNSIRHRTSLRRHQLKAALVICGTIGVAVSHALMQLLLYRGRIVDRWGLGDLIVFGAPALIAWIAYVAVFRGLGRSRFFGAFLAALALTCVSFWAGMVVALNTYGS
jgi:hypothetical protein